MYEAVIRFESGRLHRVEAGSLDMLIHKCKPYVKEESVLVVSTYKKEYVGSMKHPLLSEKDLLK